MSVDLVGVIFGMKVRQARVEAGFTLSKFAALCELSPSYVTDIERGRKYPRSDKILKIAEVLGKKYDELVSIQLPASLNYLESALSSSMIQRFPFEEFGLEAEDLVNLLTREPDKASALLHAMLEIIRRYDLKDEDFLRAALRSYQEIHENYFQELEDAALAFLGEFNGRYPLTTTSPDRETLQNLLQQEYGYTINNDKLAETPCLLHLRSVFQPGKKPVLFVNSQLYPHQIRFLLAREIGYQFLGLKERSTTSPPEQVTSFEQLLNDFKAAYFGGAILMPRAHLIPDLEQLFEQTTWNPQHLLDMLTKYSVTPEMLMYRFSELIPQFFGFKLHFLRFHNIDGRYRVVKQLNMNRLLVPSGIGLMEHYCRRWLSVRLINEPEQLPDAAHPPHVGVQLSEFVESQDRFLCLGFGRRLSLSPMTSSVIVGFRVDATLKKSVRFLEDPAVPKLLISETCERCPLTAEQCQDRAMEPKILQARQKAMERKLALSQLKIE